MPLPKQLKKVLLSFAIGLLLGLIVALVYVILDNFVFDDDPEGKVYVHLHDANGIHPDLFSAYTGGGYYPGGNYTDGGDTILLDYEITLCICGIGSASQDGEKTVPRRPPGECYENNQAGGGDLAFGLSKAKEACDEIDSSARCVVLVTGYQTCLPQPGCQQAVQAAVDDIKDDGGIVKGFFISVTASGTYDVLATSSLDLFLFP